jgi:hypothetical protein
MNTCDCWENKKYVMNPAVKPVIFWYRVVLLIPVPDEQCDVPIRRVEWD